MVTKEELCRLFDYRDGSLYRKIYTHGGGAVGRKVGSNQGNGYLSVRVNTKLYLLHRLVFLMHHGYLPNSIDHIDADKSNNKIENLRVCTHSQNGFNAQKRKNNTSGTKGVSWSKIANKWHAYIHINRVKKGLGHFDSLEEATKVAQEARIKYHGAFARC